VTAEPIVMLTAYTARQAQLLDPHCDMLLVGDSLGQVIYGLPSSVPVTLDMMAHHGAAVVRGSYHALVVVDMPFGTYEGSPQKAFASAARLLKETGCAAVKLEGGAGDGRNRRIPPNRGIPVMGHVGLTPQAVNVLGGYNGARAQRRRGGEDRQRCQGARSGWRLCHRHRRRGRADRHPVTRAVSCPTIGIGASAQCDGQVLVTEDMLGMFERVPRFRETLCRNRRD
jgi:3-methyl-2-oxobutanoate hydroxymethyltransferase